MRGLRRIRLPWAGGGALVGVLISTALPAGAEAARPLETGFSDPLFRDADAVVRAGWLDRAVDARAGTIKIFLSWSALTGSSEPAQPDDPASPGYDFASLDAAVRDARARGLEVLIGMQSAPAWAEGKDRPPVGASAPAGTWKPEPAKVRDVMVALAKRYSGSFAGLPRVGHLQLWNETNLSNFLTPQWDGKQLAAALHYKRMLNAAWRGLQGVSGAPGLVVAGLAPYGDEPGGTRSRPLRFWREVFCLKGRRALKRKRPCAGGKAAFDVFAHHAINTSGGPRRRALHPDDASSGDLAKVRRTIRAAERRGTVRGGKHPLWVTEFWWESNPPNPNGFPLPRHARFTQETLYLAWKAGYERAIQLRISDADPAVTSRFADGIYFRDGKPKRQSVRAFRFPFVAERRPGGKAKRRGRKVRVWGKAPRRGRVVIERKRPGGWRRVGALRAGRNRVFAGGVRLKGKPRLRARAGGERSLGWRVR